MADKKQEAIDHALELTFDDKDISRIKLEILYQKIIQKMNQIVDLELVFDAVEKQQLAAGHSANFKEFFQKKADIRNAITTQESDMRTAIALFNSYKEKLSGKEKKDERKSA